MRLYLPSFFQKFNLMVFNQKYFFQVSFITMVMGFGMNLYASDVSQNEEKIEKIVTQSFKPLMDEYGVAGMAVGVIFFVGADQNYLLQ